VQGETVKRNLAGSSLLLFGGSVVLLILLTAFESALMAISPGVERLLTFMLLVLPAAVGAGLGVLSLARAEGRAWMAVTGAVLNGLFALFHLMIVLFAG
jgi:hypothetical protein